MTTMEILKNIAQSQNEEIILKENDSRWVMFPVEYNGCFKFYKFIENIFWTPEAFVWPKESKQELKKLALINTILLGFPYHKNIDCDLFVDELVHSCELAISIQSPEARAFLGFQSMIEGLHRDAFKKILENKMVTDMSLEEVKPIVALVEEKQKIFMSHVNGYLEYCKTRKSAGEQGYSETNISSNHPIVYVIFVYALRKIFMFSMVGIGAILHKNLDDSVSAVSCLEKIRRDDFLIADFYCYLFINFEKKLPDDLVLQIIKQFFDAEVEFLDKVFGEENQKFCYAYLDLCVTRLLKALKIPVTLKSEIVDSSKVINVSRAYPEIQLPVLPEITDKFHSPSTQKGLAADDAAENLFENSSQSDF